MKYVSFIAAILFFVPLHSTYAQQREEWINVVQDGKTWDAKELKFDAEHRPVSFVIADGYLDKAIPSEARITVSRGKESVAYTKIELTKAVTSFDIFVWAKQNQAKPGDRLVIELVSPDRMGKKMPIIILNVPLVK